MIQLNEIIALIDFYIKINYFVTLLSVVLFLIIFNIFSLPGNAIFMIICGFFFDLYVSFVISIFSLTLGCFIFYLFTSFMILKIKPNIIKKYLSKLNNYVDYNSFEFIILFRLLPGFPLFIQNWG